MNEDLKDALAAMQLNMETKSKEQLEAEIKAFETKYKDGFTGDLNEVKDALKAVQDHANKLDVKLKNKEVLESKQANKGLSEVIADNFNEIKAVRDGQSAKIELKDTTLIGGSLVGDAPRQYSNTVVETTYPLVNFTDLIGAPINLDGGTYTFPRETASAGDIAKQIEGTEKSNIDYTFEMVDVNTDFLAGKTTYSKKY